MIGWRGFALHRVHAVDFGRHRKPLAAGAVHGFMVLLALVAGFRLAQTKGTSFTTVERRSYSISPAA